MKQDEGEQDEEDEEEEDWKMTANSSTNGHARDAYMQKQSKR